MQALFLSLAAALIKWYVGTGVFSRIEELVVQMISSDLTNDEKREYVITAIKSEYSLLRTRVIDMVIGLILTKKG